ncbi:MAG: hypothetical protein HYV07_15485 [Deltaproteobacteria bacterium]|nr:hypothetical protein [Deltaproteobacteria bacterium]
MNVRIIASLTFIALTQAACPAPEKQAAPPASKDAATETSTAAATARGLAKGERKAGVTFLPNLLILSVADGSGARACEDASQRATEAATSALDAVVIELRDQNVRLPRGSGEEVTDGLELPGVSQLETEEAAGKCWAYAVLDVGSAFHIGLAARGVTIAEREPFMQILPTVFTTVGRRF